METFIITLIGIIWTLLNLGFVNSQDSQNFYFPPSSQGRFVPSFQSPRSNFHSSRNALNTSPNSYQDQIIFLGNDGTTPKNKLPSSFASFPQFTSSRNADFFDISPRPFGVPVSQNFGRPQPPSRPNLGHEFVPQKVSGRPNIPHQNNQFLFNFNEQQALFSTEKPTTTTSDEIISNISQGQANRLGIRPFGFSSSEFSNFSKNRNSLSRQQQQQQQQQQRFSDEVSSVPQQLPFRNTHNRFQPSVQRTTPVSTTSTTTTTEKPTARYNRFGSSRTSQQVPSFRTKSANYNTGNGVFQPSTSLSTTTSNSPASVGIRSRFPSNKTSLQSRRPVVISREINEPVHLRNDAANSHIAIDHNGSDKNIVNYENIKFSGKTNNALEQDENHYDDDIKPVIEEVDNDPESIIENFQPDKEEILSTETEISLTTTTTTTTSTTSAPSTTTTIQTPTEPTSIGTSTTTTTTTSSTLQVSPTESSIGQTAEDHTVILTDNFYLPSDGSVESHEDSVEVQDEETQMTTPQNVEYEYEYEYEEDEKPLISLTKTNSTGSGNETHNISEVKPDSPSENEKTQNESKIVESTDINNDTTHNTEDSQLEYDNEEEYDDEEHENLNGSYEVEEPEETLPTHDENSSQKPNDVVGEHIVSVVTTKSVINGSTAYPQNVTPEVTSILEDNIEQEKNVTPANISEDSHVNGDTVINVPTESYVVIASIQTSRSINGARFLSFPAIEQEEKKQTLSELERQIHEQRSQKSNKKENEDKQSMTSEVSQEKSEESTIESTTILMVEPTTMTPIKSIPSQSTESIIDKLDRVQSELSSGLLTGKFPIINAMTELDTSATTMATTKKSNETKLLIPNIRKFQPKNNTAKQITNFEDLPLDDISAFLPPGFKPRPSFKNKKYSSNRGSTTTTTKPNPTTQLSHSINENNKPLRNSSISRSFKNSPSGQEVSHSGFIPKSRRLHPASTEATSPKIVKDIFSTFKFEDSLEKLLPKNYKENSGKDSTTSKPPVTFVEDISKFLPPGFKLTTTVKPQQIEKASLPPVYKPKNLQNSRLSINSSVVPLADDISKFLPAGFKVENKTKDESESLDISKLLPPGFKLGSSEGIVKTVNVKEIAGLLPAGFETLQKSDTTSTTTTTTETPLKSSTTESSYKVVFPKGIHKRPGNRLTTIKPHSVDGPAPPPITIKKGPPMRATTEFTGWPTPSTTPISIEKLLEQAKAFDISQLLPQSSSSTTSTTSTTTTTTPKPPRPTKPGICHVDCDLGGTIRIIDGVKWKPELLDHNTAEWKNLANEVEAQLNEVYNNAPHLSKWYKKIRIDSFSKGSILVDYFIELKNITRNVNTLEIKRMFHNALTQIPLPIVPLKHENDDEDSIEEEHNFREGKEQKLVKETYLLGRFVVDPISTDFIVIPKPPQPSDVLTEQDVLIPQWAIALIVIGVGSLCFVVLFGVTVLINRQKNTKKTPIPLTADMLNELNKNHMGGADNYGADEFYNIEDAWNDTKQPIKPKRFTNSTHGSNASNIYDSWSSTRHGEYYFDPNTYASHHKIDPYPNDPYNDAHQMYSYNSRSRYQREYDPDF